MSTGTDHAGTSGPTDTPAGPPPEAPVAEVPEAPVADLDPDERAALEAERDFLLSSLDDLEAERAAGDVDDIDYQRLRDDYTHRAAEVLRRLGEAPRPTSGDGPEAGEGAPADSPPTAAAARRGVPWRGLGIAALVVVLAVGAGVLVARMAGQRLPGDSATGEIRDTSASLLAEARLLMQQGQAVEAIRRFDAVLERDPRNPEALTYRGWLLVQVGQGSGQDDLTAEGVRLLDEAIATNPTYADAYVFKGLVLRDAGDLAGAVAAWEAFLANDPPPEFAAFVQGSLEELRAQLAGSSPTTGQQPPPPEAAPPGVP